MRCNSRLSLFALAHVLLVGVAQSDSVCSSASCTQGVSMIQMSRKPSVRIDGKWLVVNNKWYSRKGAHKAWLGRIGRTNGMWLAGQPVEINFRTSAPKAWMKDNVKIATTLTLTSSEFSDIAASLTADAPAMGLSGSAGINSSSTQSARYVLRGLTFDSTLRIKHWFNAAKSSKKKDRLKDDFMDLYGGLKKPRIVTTVWVLVSGDDEHAKKCTGGHLSLKYGSVQGSAGITISGKGCSESTWSFSPETIIAYEASYLEWENMRSSPPSGDVKDVVSDSDWTR